MKYKEIKSDNFHVKYFEFNLLQDADGKTIMKNYQHIPKKVLRSPPSSLNVHQSNSN